MQNLEKPIEFKVTSKGHIYTLVIIGIDSSRNDFLVGHVTTPIFDKEPVRWDKNGICRNKSHQLNLNINSPEILALKDSYPSLNW
ncbi:hypothetical protein [Acinetobacter nosocomialis]|uniref:hypothetical protein n=1 Tax=Acinetobacter nosocomialis TaxID=106654 RepID=UPI0024DEA1A5|nr:hypothetical protein [Acinetobacter nosocomialis]HAV5966186.1 hypothetical protein [Acinetobacter baumannii]HAV5968562.1 hypothetical protein [Acinetobacter baumannii]